MTALRNAETGPVTLWIKIQVLKNGSYYPANATTYVRPQASTIKQEVPHLTSAALCYWYAYPYTTHTVNLIENGLESPYNTVYIICCLTSPSI